MKVTVVLTVALLAIVQTQPNARERRHIFGYYSPQRMVSMVGNIDYVKAQVNCLLSDDATAEVLCDRIGKLLRKNLPNALRTAKCQGPCTSKDRKLILQSMEIMKTKHSVFWSIILDHYEITPEQRARLEKWAEDVRKEPH